MKCAKRDENEARELHLPCDVGSLMPSMMRVSIALGALTAFAALVVGICGLSYWNDMHIDRTRGINEAGYIKIGGIDQWVQIRGEDRNNPVLLYLNGGPGFTTIGGTYWYRDWERYYTMVMWDQRGEGKTFDRSGASVRDTMTISSFTRDGIELAEYLTRHLHKNRIILLGHSWGSMLGVHIVLARPDLFAVYVGTGQLVSEKQMAQYSYPLLVARAHSLGNTLAEQQLLAAGPPPYPPDVRKWIPLETWAQALDPPSLEESRPSPSQIWLIARGFFGPHEMAPGVTPAVQFSMSTLWPDMIQDDLTSLGLRFEVPVVFIQGTEDITTVTALAKRYFDRIDAPTKRFITLAGAGHLAIFRDRVGFLKALEEYVRPLAVSN
jgi:pimeloyl-ACP methyl ester carboxylesterase